MSVWALTLLCTSRTVSLGPMVIWRSGTPSLNLTMKVRMLKFGRPDLLATAEGEGGRPFCLNASFSLGSMARRFPLDFSLNGSCAGVAESMRRLCLVLHNQLSQSRHLKRVLLRGFYDLVAPVLVDIAQSYPTSSQALANNIFRNVGVASLTRRILFLDGVGEQELEQVHPTVQVLVKLWDFARNGLVRAFRSTLPDKRTDVMYVNVYVSLYTLCQLSSEATASDLTSVQQLDHLTAPPSIP